jgi:hypothetical protein
VTGAVTVAETVAVAVTGAVTVTVVVAAGPGVFDLGRSPPLSPTPAPIADPRLDVWIGPRNEPVLETLRPKPGRIFRCSNSSGQPITVVPSVGNFIG